MHLSTKKFTLQPETITKVPVFMVGELDWKDLNQLKTMRDRINEVIYDLEQVK